MSTNSIPGSRALPQRSRVLKNAAFYALKLSVAAVLLFWLYRKGLLDPAALGRLEMTPRVVALFALALVLVTSAVVLVSIRLRLLLRPHGIRLTLRRAFSLSLMGAFFGSVLPGLVAGDVVKTAYLFRDSPGQRSSAVATVLIDRILGLYGLLLLGTVASLAAWRSPALSGEPIVLLIAPALATAASVLLVVFMKASVSESSLFDRLLQRAPDKVRNLAAALAVYRRHPGLFPVAVLISVAGHALVVMTFYIASITIGDSMSLAGHFVIDPIAIILYMVPLTPGGLGVTESAFGYLFAEAGSPNGVVVSLLGRFVQYTVFIIGGVTALLTTRAAAGRNTDA